MFSLRFVCSLVLGLAFSTCPLLAVTIPHSFSNGQVADANKVNENFSALADAISSGANASIQFQMVNSDAMLGESSRVMAINNSNNIRLTLPEANTVPGRVYMINKLNSEFTVSIGLASGNISENHKVVQLGKAGRTELFSDGTLWHVLEGSGGSGQLIHNSGSGFGILADIYPEGSSYPQNFIEFNGKVYFQAFTEEFGTELWSTDGTAAGTQIVADIIPGYESSYPYFLTAVGSKLYFQAYQPDTGYELWSSDGTSAGTNIVLDIFPGTSSSSPQKFTAVGTKLVFTAYTPVEGRELWVSDGTAAGTNILMDIYPGSTDSYIENMISLGTSKVVFRAQNDTDGQELYVSDGTPSGTNILMDIYPGASGSYPNYLTEMGGAVYFQADDGTSGSELWKTDGTIGGTNLLMDIAQTTNPSSYPTHLTSVSGMLYFTATDDTNGTEPWVSDGTVGGTHLLVDINPGVSSSYVEDFESINGRIILFDSDYDTLYSFDGSTLETLGAYYALDDSEVSPDNYRYLQKFRNGILFVNYEYDQATGDNYYLNFTDGTKAGTVQLTKDKGMNISDFKVMGDRVYFSAENNNYGNWGRELYIMGDEFPPEEPPLGLYNNNQE